MSQNSEKWDALVLQSVFVTPDEFDGLMGGGGGASQNSETWDALVFQSFFATLQKSSELGGGGGGSL